jgi:hypothetical protein
VTGSTFQLSTPKNEYVKPEILHQGTNTDTPRAPDASTTTTRNLLAARVGSDGPPMDPFIGAFRA